jgi:hypothetical protein
MKRALVLVFFFLYNTTIGVIGVIEVITVVVMIISVVV